MDKKRPRDYNPHINFADFNANTNIHSDSNRRTQPDGYAQPDADCGPYCHSHTDSHANAYDNTCSLGLRYKQILIYRDGRYFPDQWPSRDLGDFQMFGFWGGISKRRIIDDEWRNHQVIFGIHGELDSTWPVY